MEILFSISVVIYQNNEYILPNLIFERHLWLNKNEKINRVNLIMNNREISLSLFSQGQVDNSIGFMLSDQFVDLYSLSQISKTIRLSIKKNRNEEFIIRWLRIVEYLMSKIQLECKAWNYCFYSNEIHINSNIKCDWSDQVDFGINSYKFRFFHQNPFKDQNGFWIRDQQSIEVTFRIDKGQKKDQFIQQINKDIKNNFQNIQFKYFHFGRNTRLPDFPLFQKFSRNFLVKT